MKFFAGKLTWYFIGVYNKYIYIYHIIKNNNVHVDFKGHYHNIKFLFDG